MVTDIEPSAALQPASPLPAPVTKPNSVSAAKKKKKRRNAANGTTATGSDNSSVSASPPPSEALDDSTHSDTSAPAMERWKHRVQSLRSSLSQAQADNRILSADLKAATARANDAEQAESAVNKGLLSARAVISQRDRSIAELNAMVSNQRADLRRLEEEKKKLDRRLVLLKTVSANLQEAREERDTAERKLDDSQCAAARLKKKLAHMEQVVEANHKQLEVLEMKHKQVHKLEGQLRDLRQEKQSAEHRAARRSVVAAGAGALGGLAAALAVSLVTRKADDDEQHAR